MEAKTSGPNELIKAVATDFGTSEGRAAARDGVQARLSGSKPAEVRDKAIAALREAAAIVDAKAPDEAAAFKDWLRQIAQKTAEASTEGGFLGFGGVQVSEAEKATLAEIASALAGPAHSAPGAAATGSAGAPSGREENTALGRPIQAGPPQPRPATGFRRGPEAASGATGRPSRRRDLPGQRSNLAQADHQIR